MTTQVQELKIPRSIGDLINLVQDDPDLSDTARRNMASALRRFGQVDGRGPATPCDAMSLRYAIGRAVPAKLEISRRNWGNVVSLVRKAAQTYRAASGKTYPKALSPAWRRLRDAIVATGVTRYKLGLSRFLHWASGSGLDPQGIDDAAFDRFLHHLEGVALVKDAATRHRDTAKLWNSCVDQVPGWPKKLVAVPSRRRGFSLPWRELPPAFIVDLDTYSVLIAGKAPCDARAPDVPRRESTVHATREGFRRLLCAALQAGIPPERLTSLAALLDREILTAALTWYLARLGGPRASLFEAVAKLPVMAHCYLGLPDSEIEWLTAILQRLNCRKKGMTGRNLARIRPFATPRNLARFVHLGDRLRDAADRQNPGVRRAIQRQTAIAHDLLLRAPMRFGNLIGLTLDRHIVIERHGRRATVRITLAAAEVKNGLELSFELHEPVSGLIINYLEHDRPLLVVDNENHFLFPGKGRAHLTEVALRDRLCNAVRREVGLDVHPHLYRHLAAFIYLQNQPGDYETVRRLLGHKSLMTTTDFYIAFESWSAQKAYHRILDTPHEGLSEVRP